MEILLEAFQTLDASSEPAMALAPIRSCAAAYTAHLTKKQPAQGGLEGDLLEEGGSEDCRPQGEPLMCLINLHAT
jgi:hypothetical protein